MMKILVVTGGIGSGKSEVCRILSRNGLKAQYNADKRVKDLYSSVPGLVDTIEESLGCKLHDGEGTFQPKLLAQRIFSDREALETVESLVFPELVADFREFADNACEDIVVFESATILEKPQFEGFGDKVMLVDAPLHLRLERACARDGVDKDVIKSRMANQKLMNSLSDGAYDARIDAVIVNDSTIDILEERIEKTMSDLFGDWRKDIV